MQYLGKKAFVQSLFIQDREIKCEIPMIILFSFVSSFFPFVFVFVCFFFTGMEVKQNSFFS